MNVSKYVAIFSFVFIQLISVGKVFANADEWMTTFRENIAQTWQQPEHYDLYIPAITWHARFAYDKEKPIAITSDRGVAVLACRVGMKKETGMACMPWHLRTRGTNGNRLPDTDGKVPRPLADENFHLGLGFTAGVTARDNWNYIPLPVSTAIGLRGLWPSDFSDDLHSGYLQQWQCVLCPGCAFSFETNEVLVTSLKSIAKISNIKNNATFITF